MPLLLCLIVLYSLMNPSPHEEPSRKIHMMLEEEEMVIIFLPLTDGEATILKHANGKTMLINAGGEHTERELKRWFDQFHVTKIDELLLTSEQPSYAGALDWIQKTYDPKVIRAWEVKKIDNVFPHLKVEPLYVQHKAATLSIQYGRFRLLYMNHADDDVERKLMLLPLSDVNILKVAHFGTVDYPRTRFLKHIDPQVAIIFKKRGDWPNGRLLERLYAAWIDCYETNRFGAIVVKCDLDDYEVMTF